MKIDMNQKLTNPLKRTTNAFFQTMYTLLIQKSFEDISVQELCDQAQYPRATFYNYFEDKYDLMQAMWQYYIFAKIQIEEMNAYEPQVAMQILMNRFCDLVDAHSQEVQQLLYYNHTDGFFLSSLRSYLRIVLTRAFENCPLADNYEVPFTLLAEHYANTIYLILEWLYCKDQPCTRDQAYYYLCYLLGQLMDIGSSNNI